MIIYNCSKGTENEPEQTRNKLQSVRCQPCNKLVGM